jgi:hypothetical protein
MRTIRCAAPVSAARGTGQGSKFTGRGYAIQELAVENSDSVTEGESRGIHLQLSGRRGVETLLVAIGDIKGVIAAKLSSPDHGKE